MSSAASARNRRISGDFLFKKLYQTIANRDSGRRLRPTPKQQHPLLKDRRERAGKEQQAEPETDGADLRPAGSCSPCFGGGFFETILEDGSFLVDTPYR